METILERENNRQNNEIRATTIKIGVIKGAQGSCLLQKERIKIMSSVQTKQQDEISEFEFHVKVNYAKFEIQTPQTAFKTTRKEIETTEIITQTLKYRIDAESNIGKIITVNIFVLEEDGSVMDGIINSASLALFNAGIKMDSILVSTTVVKLNGSNKFIIDPTQLEEENKQGSLLIACIPETSSITQVFMDGVLDPQDISMCLSIALDSCWKLWEEINKIAVVKMEH